MHDLAAPRGLLASLLLVAVTGAASCGGSDVAHVGSGGTGGGAAGHGGATVDGGAGTGGSAIAGTGGASAGSTGTAGTGGSAGSSGTAGTAGSSGSAGTAGSSGGAGTGGSSGGAGTGGTAPALTIDTISQVQARAGDVLTVVCVLTGATAETEVLISPPDAVVRQGNDLIAAKAGTVTFTCAARSLGILDSTPATTTILPGSAAHVHTTVDSSSVAAGWTVYATCAATDAFGNAVTVTATLAVSPTGATPVGLSVRLTASGDYQLACQVPGAQSDAAAVHVDPGLPATLRLSASPTSAVYPAGQVLSVSYQVLDAFGNTVPGIGVDLSAAAVMGTGPVAAPTATSFRFDADGSYEIRGAVVGPTATGAPVTAVLPISIDGLGPAVTCDSPAANGVVVLSPGAVFNLTGTATDPNGVAGVAVNGAPVTLDAAGVFTAPVTTRYGLNYVDVVATDALGTARHELCTFLIADRFVDEGALLANSVMLRLAQSAVDDNSRAGSVNSFDDILFSVLNSQGLKDTLDSALKAANPLKADSCDQQVCVFGACACVLSSQIVYTTSSLPGPNTVTATLVNGGIQVRTRFEDPNVRMRITGMAAGVPYDSTGDVNIDFVEVDVTYDVGVDGAGRPDVTVRPNTVAARVGSITTNFSGVDGFVINIAVGLANGTVRNIVANTLQTFVVNNFSAVLDGLVSNLTVTTLPTAYDVPRVGGAGAVRLSFGLGYSSVGVNTSRMLFGMGTRFTAPAAQARQPARAPLPPSDAFVDPNAGGLAVAGADHVGVFQQALQAFWRGGGLDGTSTPAAGTTIVHTTALPPVIAFKTGAVVTVDIGGVDATVTVPGAPSMVHARAGARASATAVLAGDDVSFTTVTLDEIHVAAPDVALDATAQQALTDAMAALLLNMATRSLNDVLPALPVSSFPIPASLATFGLPVGGSLGMTNPTMTLSQPHFVLRGAFGIR